MAEAPAKRTRSAPAASASRDAAATPPAHRPGPGRAGHEPGLALDRGRGLEPRARQRRREARGGHVLVEVARLEGDDVNFAALAHPVEVIRLEHGAFAKVGPEV